MNENVKKTCREIFPSSFVSGLVRNQEELDAAFSKYPNLSRTYVQIALHWKDTRRWYEDNWPRTYKYLDKNFLERFQTKEEHHARAWEFHVAVVFLEKGLQMKEKTWKYGPDFCMETPDEKKIWIEAVTCDLGTVDPVEPYPVMIPGQIYSFGGNIEDEHRPRALRITSAISTKFEKFKSYLQNPSRSGVSESDCLLIAVNGAAIQHFSEQRALFKRAIFGQGPDIYVKVPGKEKLKGPFYKPVPTITKKVDGKNREIPANFMGMSEFSKISAVLYCGYNVSHSWLNGYKIGDDFLFAYHTRPDNPIPDSVFRFGRGVRKDLQIGTIADQEQK